MTNWDQATYEALQEDAPVSVESRLIQQADEIEMLREGLEDATRMLQFEDRGWSLIGALVAEDHLEGLELEELKEVSKKIRPRVALNGLTKNGATLHTGYVFSKGVNIAGTDAPSGRGRPSELRNFFTRKANQDSIFSASAHMELQKARYSDGNVYLVCDKASGTVRRVPLNEITAIKVNPDFPEEVWAYQRTWNPQTAPNSKPLKRWYYSSRFTGTKQRTITRGGETVAVDKAVMIDKRFNRQVGWPLGIPDALAAMPWIAAYEEIVQYGRVVSESLSKILYKVISKSKAGSQNAAAKIATMTGYGNTASMVEGQDVAAMNNAGRGYDFAAARPVAAMAAAALSVPNIELLSDSAAAGSSYGAAQSLSPATENTMRSMQDQWVEMYHEVFDVFGLGSPRVWFEPLKDIDPYRKAQQVKLYSDALSDEEYRGIVLDDLDIPGDPAKIPDVLKLRSVDTGTAVQQAAPDQGQSNGSNSGGNGANDLRTDSIGESLRREMANEEFLNRFESLIERAEATSIK